MNEKFINEFLPGLICLGKLSGAWPSAGKHGA